LVLVTQVGCAARPENISARYVSPVGYQAWNCDQLTEERRRLMGEVERVADLQRSNANADAAMLAVGLIILWPVLIGMAATTDRREELGRLRGEYDAVESATRVKACPVPPPPFPAE
jgi:hypothetical protein